MASIADFRTAKQVARGSIEWFDQCIERGKNEVFSEVVTLTPALAIELLRRNKENRTARSVKVQQIAADIRRGAWTFNGEPIIVANTGQLNDGQHRALAVVEANMAIVSLVVFGLPRQSNITIDQGANRSASDYMTMGAIPNAPLAAAILRNVIGFEVGEGKDLNSNRLVSNADILARYERDQRIAESAKWAAANQAYTRQFVAGSVLGFCHYILAGINPIDAGVYMGQVARGEQLKTKSPAYVVRDRLLAMGKTGQAPKVHVIFRGWNAFRQGRSIDHTRIVGNLPALV